MPDHLGSFVDRTQTLDSIQRKEEEEEEKEISSFFFCFPSFREKAEEEFTLRDSTSRWMLTSVGDWEETSYPPIVFKADKTKLPEEGA